MELKVLKAKTRFRSQLMPLSIKPLKFHSVIRQHHIQGGTGDVICDIWHAGPNRVSYILRD
jgi:hypothetical protein